MRRVPLLITMVMLLMLIFLACGPSGPPEEPAAPEATATEEVSEPSPTLTRIPASPTTHPTPTLQPSPTPEPPPELGTRMNPIPLGQQVGAVTTGLGETREYNVAILETIRGEPAWLAVQDANMFNDAPAEGNEYVLVRARVEYLSGPSDETSQISVWDFNIVTSAGVTLDPPSIVDPEPAFEAQFFPGGSVEGWMTFEVPANDPVPLLVFGMGYDGSGGVYFALVGGEGGPAPEPQPEEPTAALPPTPDTAAEVGTRMNPIPLGQQVGAVTTELGETRQYNVTVLETVRGEPAWVAVQDANMFNDPPAEGNEYVLARARVEYLSGPSDETSEISVWDFNIVTSAGVTLDPPSIVDPEPAFEAQFFPGGSVEGWMTFEVPANDPVPLLVFGMGYDGSGGVYFALQ